jgi:hypothetical protein
MWRYQIHDMEHLVSVWVGLGNVPFQQSLIGNFPFSIMNGKKLNGILIEEQNVYTHKDRILRLCIEL